MQLIIITPEKKETHAVEWVELNTSHGNYIIQPGHAATIFALSAGAPFIYCLSNGKQHTLTINRAIAQVTRENVTLLLSSGQ